MLILIRVIKLLTISAVLYQCTTSKEIYYSYKVNTYSINNVKHLIYLNNLISYGDYLFEFKNRENKNRFVKGGVDTTYIYYDTVGVYLLAGINKLYYEYDTFALKNELIKTGKLSEKQFGVNFKSSGTGFPSDVFFKPLRKTVINSINCYTAEMAFNNKTGNDSIKQELVLIKNKKLNSVYKINGIRFPDSNYCIVGFHIFHLKNKESILQDIESMRPLTDKEIEICESMIKKSKSAAVDTIKGMPSK